MAHSSNGQGKITIIVALITLIGTIVTAVFTNWDKIFSKGQEKLLSEKTVEKEAKPTAGISDSMSNLSNYLSKSKWKEADFQTTDIFYKILERGTNRSKLTLEELLKIDCKYFNKINQLWLNHSEKKFGFSVQNKIHSDSKNDYNAYFKTVGWGSLKNPVSYSDLTDKLTDAPHGHFPHGGVFDAYSHRDIFFLVKKCRV